MSLPGYNEPFPSRDPIVKGNGNASDVFIRWQEQSVLRRLDSTPVLVQPVTQIPATGTSGENTSQSGTLGGSQSGGLYQVTGYLEVITGDAGGSPSVALEIAWTHNGKAFIRTFTAMLGTNNLISQGITSPIEIDAGTSISFALTYVSGSTPGQFHYSAALGASLIQAIA